MHLRQVAQDRIAFPQSEIAFLQRRNQSGWVHRAVFRPYRSCRTRRRRRSARTAGPVRPGPTTPSSRCWTSRAPKQFGSMCPPICNPDTGSAPEAGHLTGAPSTGNLHPHARGTPAHATPPPRTLAVLAALAAAAAPGVAYGLEVWGELAPCALCLLERWPYRMVIVLGCWSHRAEQVVPVRSGSGCRLPAGGRGHRRGPCRRGIQLVAKPAAGMRRAAFQWQVNRGAPGLHAGASGEAMR